MCGGNGSTMALKERGAIRVGIGGWSYEPWRETFYPGDVPKKRELEYASRKVTMIEVNATFYRLQKPSTFAGWRDQTPEDFVFAVKAPRYVTIRQALGEAGPAIERFVESGLAELGTKLGPLLWQLAPTKRYERDEIEAFLALLPKAIGGRRARHVIEPRHESFKSVAFVEQLRRHGASPVFADSDEYPSIADVTSDFVYARLMRSQASVDTGYALSDLDRFAGMAAAWSRGEEPGDLPRLVPASGKLQRRDVYVLFINGAKERAPAAAQALLSRL
jgi:uncharacterized protein YecE (DUF72 family)